MSLPQVRIISRKACCLCEDAEAAALQLVEMGLCSLDVVDVDAELELAARYGADVPVLLIDGEERMKHIITQEALESVLMQFTKENKSC